MEMLNSNTQCALCGLVVTDEVPNGDLAQRKPCPQCGSMSRILSAEMHSTATPSEAFCEANVITYPQTLLNFCRSLIGDGQFPVSVVVAHMACEIATERSLSDAFAMKGIQYLKSPVLAFFNGYNLVRDENRKLYNALTDDNIGAQPFWEGFAKSATLRNKIIHKGKLVSKDEAELSFQAATAYVSYLKQ